MWAISSGSACFPWHYWSGQNIYTVRDGENDWNSWSSSPAPLPQKSPRKWTVPICSKDRLLSQHLWEHRRKHCGQINPFKITNKCWQRWASHLYFNNAQCICAFVLGRPFRSSSLNDLFTLNGVWSAWFHLWLLSFSKLIMLFLFNVFSGDVCLQSVFINKSMFVWLLHLALSFIWISSLHLARAL